MTVQLGGLLSNSGWYRPRVSCHDCLGESGIGLHMAIPLSMVRSKSFYGIHVVYTEHFAVNPPKRDVALVKT